MGTIPTPAKNDVLQIVKNGILTVLSAASIAKVYNRHLLEVTEFGIPARRFSRCVQFILHGKPWGQAGGMFNLDVTVEFAAVVRKSQDTQGRFDLLLREGRIVLAKIQQALEGQSFNELELPLYTDLGPTKPEVMEVEPPFGITYLSMSGTKHQLLYEALGLANWEALDQGYVYA